MNELSENGLVLNEHRVKGEDPSRCLTVEVLDPESPGGASCRYRVRGDRGASPDGDGQAMPPFCIDILFQNGSTKYGCNGVTNEALLLMVIDRLRGFQTGPLACRDNAVALEYCEMALTRLKQRTADRIARGVEGTDAP